MSRPAFQYHRPAFGFANRPQTFRHPREGMTYRSSRDPHDRLPLQSPSQMFHVPTPQPVDRENFMFQMKLKEIMDQTELILEEEGITP